VASVSWWIATARGSTLKPSEAVGGEATLKVCGVGVAMLSG
jgi:hypothetical protein